MQVSEDGTFQFWREYLEIGSGAETILSADDGVPALVKQGKLHYLGGWPDQALMHDILRKPTNTACLVIKELNDGIRLRSHGNHVFAFNYGAISFDLATLGWTGEPLLGELVLEPSGVAIAA